MYPAVTIDQSAALNLLRAGLQIKGADHRQEKCVYVENLHQDPRPGCLIGSGFWATLGKERTIEIVDTPVYPECDTSGLVNGESINLVSDALADRGVYLNSAASIVLQVAQEAQDGRGFWATHSVTWGGAVQAAEAWIAGDQMLRQWYPLP